MRGAHLGIDVGGTGMKAAPVDVDTGSFVQPRLRIPTPRPATPEAMAGIVAELVESFSWTGPIGIGFPGVVKDQAVRTAANLDPSWIGVDVAEVFGAAAGGSVNVVNDADAAGLAEMRYGAGRDRRDAVLLVTLGTGIGCAFFYGGVLIPNTEFGHIEIRGKDAERRAAESVREREGLSWTAWADRVDEYLRTLESLVWPDLIILGGGVSKRSDRFLDRIHTRCDVVPAQLLNEAGIVGAALAAIP